MLKALMEATSKDQTRPVLAGIAYIEHKDKEYFVATDGAIAVFVKGKALNKVMIELQDEYALKALADYNPGDVLYLNPKTRPYPRIVSSEDIYPDIFKAVPQKFTNPKDIRPIFTSGIIKRLEKIWKIISGQKQWVYPQYWNTERGACVSIDDDAMVLAMPWIQPDNLDIDFKLDF